MDHYALSEQKYRLILVEDDDELSSLVQEYLTKNGFEVSVVQDGSQAVEQILSAQPDLVILDIMLPGLSGMEVCRQVRNGYSAPILMLTALDEDMDQMLGLELGADDYVIKPIKPRLLLSRIRALLRRSEITGRGALVPSAGDRAVSDSSTSNPSTANPTSAQTKDGQAASPGAIPVPSLKSNGLEIDFQSRTVHINQRMVHLTTAEFDLLSLLAKKSGSTVSRDEILHNLRGFEYDGLDRSIDRRISRLRKKLNDDPIEPKLIKTVRGKGYLLCPVTPNENKSEE
ncbi:transcriptional regulator [Oleiphilus messinensis]|uniref:Transcriptional regulator n=1 Tax=Oleiphilus messinensis TaxID=141451 RepID=A0A1Y0IBL3_9GAMM|nr:response regulator [Oleiphilus messinensis]ARU57932.1 transcriptional regulator [Oleiphilus messinensis]